MKRKILLVVAAAMILMAIAGTATADPKPPVLDPNSAPSDTK